MEKVNLGLLLNIWLIVYIRKACASRKKIKVKQIGTWMHDKHIDIRGNVT